MSASEGGRRADLVLFRYEGHSLSDQVVRDRIGQPMAIGDFVVRDRDVGRVVGSEPYFDDTAVVVRFIRGMREEPFYRFGSHVPRLLVVIGWPPSFGQPTCPECRNQLLAGDGGRWWCGALGGCGGGFNWDTPISELVEGVGRMNLWMNDKASFGELPVFFEGWDLEPSDAAFARAESGYEELLSGEGYRWE